MWWPLSFDVANQLVRWDCVYNIACIWLVCIYHPQEKKREKKIRSRQHFYKPVSKTTRTEIFGTVTRGESESASPFVLFFFHFFELLLYTGARVRNMKLGRLMQWTLHMAMDLGANQPRAYTTAIACYITTMHSRFPKQSRAKHSVRWFVTYIHTYIHTYIQEEPHIPMASWSHIFDLTCQPVENGPEWGDRYLFEDRYNISPHSRATYRMWNAIYHIRSYKEISIHKHKHRAKERKKISEILGSKPAVGDQSWVIRPIFFSTIRRRSDIISLIQNRSLGHLTFWKNITTDIE
jgi:tRNA nucleotidyltransferase/poly(A) polymerase